MINTLELWKAMLAQLGAEGTQRYIPRRDGIYAINGAMRKFEALATPLLADRKGSEESLSELQETRIFQTNNYGGLMLDNIQPSSSFPYQLWSVIAVMAEPTTQNPTPVVPIGVLQDSYIRTDLIYMPGGANERPVERMTMEEVAKAARNRFLSGNERMANTPFRKYGYYIMGQRIGFLGGNRELVITPVSLTSRRLVAMSYLRSPDPLTAASLDANGEFLSTSNIPFPNALFDVMRSLALNEIAVKQGDGTTLYSITEKDIARLLISQN